MVEEQILKNSGVRVTAMRILILRTINREFSGIFNMADLEEKLPTVDKSTIFRTLSVFQEHHLLDNIDDGSGSQKYCICNLEDKKLNRRHVHFSCKICRKTTCLTNVSLPFVALPSGYEVEDIEYVVKGICPKCKKRQTI